MPAYVIGNFFIFSLINAFTPGPGNILALNTVTNYGYKKGRPLFLGIFAGYYVVQILCAVFVFGLSSLLPGVLGVMKYIGAAYILFLAIHIAVSKLPEEDAEGGCGDCCRRTCPSSCPGFQAAEKLNASYGLWVS